MKMFLNGTAMQGQPDHPNLLGAPMIKPARTAPRYRFFAVRDEFPGLVPGDAETPYGPGEPASIQGELYEFEESVWHTSLGPGEPPELELGTIELDDGSQVNAMILQFDRIAPGDKVVEITSFGGWRAYQSSLRGMG